MTEQQTEWFINSIFLKMLTYPIYKQITLTYV